jgi:hypothetical protein
MPTVMATDPSGLHQHLARANLRQAEEQISGCWMMQGAFDFRPCLWGHTLITDCAPVVKQSA